MTFEQFRLEPHVPFEVLDKLITAGLGNRPQQQITRSEFEAAMAVDHIDARIHEDGQHKPGREFPKSAAVARQVTHRYRRYEQSTRQQRAEVFPSDCCSVGGLQWHSSRMRREIGRAE